MGAIRAVTGESREYRGALPNGDCFGRPRARATVERGDDCGRIIEQEVVGSSLVVTLDVLSPVRGDFPINLRVSVGPRNLHATATVRVGRSLDDTLALATMVGGQATADVPFKGQLWKDATFRAAIEPPKKEFRLSLSKGEMAAGSKMFPFKVLFTPHDTRAVTGLLVVSFNDGASEYAVELSGGVSGFSGRNRRGHA
jgi:hypothetical protein